MSYLEKFLKKLCIFVIGTLYGIVGSFFTGTVLLHDKYYTHTYRRKLTIYSQWMRWATGIKEDKTPGLEDSYKIHNLRDNWFGFAWIIHVILWVGVLRLSCIGHFNTIFSQYNFFLAYISIFLFCQILGILDYHFHLRILKERKEK
jgi:hypothetical protein